MLALAYVMNYSGATATLGLALAATGALFPFFGALLGWLGVFLTGSDTSANALFGNLQVVTANNLGLDPALMAAGNSSGGVMGKMISLQSISVAAAATGMPASDEARLFGFTLKHSMFLACIVGLIVTAYAYVVKSRAQASFRTALRSGLHRCAHAPSAGWAQWPRRHARRPGDDAQLSPSDTPAAFRERTESFDYMKREEMIAMRDGVKLKTFILIPKGASHAPMLLTRTPYNAAERVLRFNSPHLASVVPQMDDTAVAAGYIIVYQDIRGKYGSEGDYVMTRPLHGPLNPTDGRSRDRHVRHHRLAGEERARNRTAASPRSAARMRDSPQSSRPSMRIRR